MSDSTAMTSLNPFTGETIQQLPLMDATQTEAAVEKADDAYVQWKKVPMEERAKRLHAAADVIEQGKEKYAALVTAEMGKLKREAIAEIEKCALVCRFYADHAADFLADEIIETDASKSIVVHQPIGIVLAVMPWNFPFWQVFRFAAPALMAGNVGLLKHASNVPQCAVAIESIFRQAGLPEGCFTTLMIGSRDVRALIQDKRIKAVTLTGSETAGRAVASAAGDELKKSVLELGGSDAFIVLEDADLDHTIPKAVASRFMNAGQSCIAAKRFLVLDSIADEFVIRFADAVSQLKQGDPSDDDTGIAPMARDDLRDELDEQVRDALAQGAKAVVGCAPVAESFAQYQASILDGVTPSMRAWSEELFGPVAIVIRVKDEAEAIAIANSSEFGLGGSVWTQDRARGERVARELECGCAFVNELVKSDPRVPFGGTKRSGYGRELSRLGILEFVNAKTIWMD